MSSRAKTPKTKPDAAKRRGGGARKGTGKTAKKTAIVRSPELVAQPNGRGALLSGGMPGNAGGPGRPRSLIRERLAGSYEQRIEILEEIADGEPMQRIDVPLATILPHVRCPSCGDPVEPKDPESLFLLAIRGTISASPKDRLSALDQMGKYGGIAPKEMPVDEVRKRLRATIDAVERVLPAVDAQRVLAAIRPAWAMAA